MVSGIPANDIADESGPAEPPNGSTLDGSDAKCVALALASANDTSTVANDSGTSVAGATTRHADSESAESSGSSVRLTPAGGIEASIRGELRIPAHICPWERGILFTLVEDLLQDLSNAATESHERNS
jgi:hypothetical protein